MGTRGGPSAAYSLTVALVFSSVTSIGFFLARWLVSGSTRYWFLNWNLLLAWLPLLFAWLLVRELKTKHWPSWQCLSLSALWLGFLPNSFYLLSDFVHLRSTGEVGILYDAAMFASFAFSGLALGFGSLLLVHTALFKRLSSRSAHLLVAGVLLLCSFAIYLGRSLRWNTWDVLINPAGLLFDVSDRFINLTGHPQVFTTTAVFFALLGSMYAVIWTAWRYLRSPVR